MLTTAEHDFNIQDLPRHWDELSVEEENSDIRNHRDSPSRYGGLFMFCESFFSECWTGSVEFETLVSSIGEARMRIAKLVLLGFRRTTHLILGFTTLVVIAESEREFFQHIQMVMTSRRHDMLLQVGKLDEILPVVYAHTRARNPCVNTLDTPLEVFNHLGVLLIGQLGLKTPDQRLFIQNSISLAMSIDAHGLGKVLIEVVVLRSWVFMCNRSSCNRHWLHGAY